MRTPHRLHIVLFAALIGAGLIGPAAFAAEHTGGSPVSGLIADDKDDKTKPAGGDGGKNKPEAKDDKAKDDKVKAGEEQTDKADKAKDDGKAKDDKTTRANPPTGGNAGAIFVKGGATTGPGNEALVGCGFYVAGTNFSSAPGTIAFYAWNPAGNFQPVSPVTGSSTYAGGSSTEFLNGPYSLPTDGQTPHSRHGYHYKVEAVDAGGKKVSSKVFWVDCPATTANAVAQPNTNPPATSGPTVTATPAGTAPVTLVLTTPITVNGPTGPIELVAGTTITVPSGTVLTSLPGRPAPAPQLVEVEPGTVLGTSAHGAVTSDEEAIGEVVLGEQVSILAAGLPRSGGVPLGAVASLGAALALVGALARRRSSR